jgi:hypothetical protein
MTNQLKAHFPSLNETFALEPLFDPGEGKLFWVIEDEQDRWYKLTGFPTSIMMRRGGQVFCHSSEGVKVGELV